MSNLTNSKLTRTPRRPVAITIRDRAMLLALVEFRVLSTEQIRWLFFPSIHRTRKRLFLLWRHGFLRRATRPTRIGEGSAQFLYALSAKGRRLVGDQSLRLRPQLIDPKKFNEHSELINNLHICLLLVERAADDLAVRKWEQGAKLKMYGTATSAAISTAVPIIPDAMFILSCRGRDYCYFVEVDRGHTDLGRIEKKCAYYSWLWWQKVPQRQFGIRSFRVLYLTTGGRRLVHVMEKIREQQRNSTCPDLIAGVTGDAVSLSDPQKLFSMAWRTVAPSGDIVSSCPLPSPSFVRSRQRPEHHLCADQNPDASCKETPGPVDEGSPRLPSSGSG